MRARGLWPPALARAALITTSAAAPSLREEAFPAVTTPPSRLKAGLSEAIFFTSIVVYCSSVNTFSSPWVWFLVFGFWGVCVRVRVSVRKRGAMIQNSKTRIPPQFSPI